MVTYLIQRLKTCSAKERRTVAVELAKTGSNEAVSELIRMIEGKRRHRTHRYDVQDQILGVESIADTRSRRALEYLKKLNTPRYRSDGTVSSEKVYYPHAKKGLKKRLQHRVFIHRPYGDGYDGYQYTGESYTSCDDMDAYVHNILTSAIQRLEATTQNVPRNR